MSEPIVLVFAGPNGSGKSTAAKKMQLCGAYVNADDLKKEHGLTDIRAAEMAEALRNKLVDQKSDFTFETVLSTDRNMLLLKRAKASGYAIRCVYALTCNADINVARVRGRVREGGHDVPEDKIRSRYYKALKLLPELIGICDKIFVFDTSRDNRADLIFKKDGDGGEYFPTEVWSAEKLKDLCQT